VGEWSWLRLDTGCHESEREEAYENPGRHVLKL